MDEELENERIRAEIEKIRAEIQGISRPRFAQSYALPIAIALIGSIGGVAAILNAWVQIQDLKYTQSAQLLAAREETIRVLKLEDDANKSLIEANNSLARIEAKRIALTKMNADLTANNLLLKATAKQSTDANAVFIGQAVTAKRNTGTTPTVMLFARGKNELERIKKDCVPKLQSAGFIVLGAELVGSGPVHDEVKLFWETDWDNADKIRDIAKGCGLNVPQDNVIWITAPDGTLLTNYPHNYFEVWTAASKA